MIAPQAAPSGSSGAPSSSRPAASGSLGAPSSSRPAASGSFGAPSSSRRTAQPHELFGALAIILAAAGLVAGPRLAARLSSHPTTAECDALLARYVELKGRSVTEKLDPKSYAAALDAARALAGPSLRACTTEVTLEEADCARKANHVDEFERCLH